MHMEVRNRHAVAVHILTRCQRGRGVRQEAQGTKLQDAGPGCHHRCAPQKFTATFQCAVGLLMMALSWRGRHCTTRALRAPYTLQRAQENDSLGQFTPCLMVGRDMVA